LALRSIEAVTVNWTASSGGNFYTLYPLDDLNNGGGASNVLATISSTIPYRTLHRHVPTDGKHLQLLRHRTSSAARSPGSTRRGRVALPATSQRARFASPGFCLSSIVLHWSAFPGAVGYIIRRATSSGGPYAYIPKHHRDTYTDPGLNAGTTYYYQVTAVNAADVSPNATVTVVPAPLAPISLSAIAGNGQVVLSGHRPGRDRFTTSSAEPTRR